MIGQYVTPELIIRCQKDVMNVIINWNRYITTDSANFTYRIDKGSPSKSKWSMATNNEAAGLWDNGRAISFTKKLFDKNHFLVAVYPYGENQVVTNFNVQNLRKKIKPLREACHW